jgi:hypothetical protein
MAQQHRDFAMHMYESLNQRNLEGFLEGVDEDVEFRSLIAESEGETFRGHEGVRAWWTQVVQALGGLGFEITDYSEEGETGVVKLRVRGNVGTTGIEQVMFQGIALRDGKAIWWETFRTESEAWARVRERFG